MLCLFVYVMCWQVHFYMDTVYFLVQENATVEKFARLLDTECIVEMGVFKFYYIHRESFLVLLREFVWEELVSLYASREV